MNRPIRIQFYFFLAIFCFFLWPDLNAIESKELVEKHVPKYHSNAKNILPFTHTRTPEGSLKLSLLQMLKTAFGSEIFIETGTYLGDTTAVAAAIFSEVHTVELFPELFNQAHERFKDNAG